MNEYPTRELFRKDYIFQREFLLADTFLIEEKIELVCEGLDTLAEIYINGEKIFYADNMHRTWKIPVKKYLHSGKNQIRIEFLSVLEYIENYRFADNKEAKFIASGAIKGNQLVRKVHSMFGWDWGPQLVDAGIFRDIYLEGWMGRRINEVEIRQKHNHGEVELHVRIRMMKMTATRITGMCGTGRSRLRTIGNISSGSAPSLAFSHFRH